MLPQTHTQAERKIMEAKREELLREDYENTFMGALQEKLVELESIKPQPYGAFDAVCLIHHYVLTMTYVLLLYSNVGKCVVCIICVPLLFLLFSILL